MQPQVFRDMVDVMAKRGGPYAGMDIPEFYELVRELFSPEEAELNNALPRNPITAEEIAKERGRCSRHAHGGVHVVREEG
jgi:hypothetical protein